MATEPSAAISFLNQQRATNGIPPIPLDQTLLQSYCSLENHHIASPSTGWSANGSPWSGAPLHQLMLYDPTHNSTAYGEYNGFSSSDPRFPSESGTWACMWFNFNWTVAKTVAPTPTFYAFTSEDGRFNVPRANAAYEFPTTPAEITGLPSRTATGPNILLYAFGMGQDARIAGATITPEGRAPVATRVVDGTTEWQGRRALYSWQGVVFPRAPLEPNTAYQVHVTWQRAEDGLQAIQDITFRTADEPKPAPRSTCHRVLHQVRYRQRYRDNRGHWRSRWRTKPHLHRQRYRDRSGRVRYRWIRHYITPRGCRSGRRRG